MQKFGEISYEDYPKLTDSFVTQLRDGKIVANRCKICSEKYFPPRSACVNFHDPAEMEYFEISNKGELKAFTIIHFAPDSHADKAPYIVAIGQMEDGFRLLAHLVGVTSKPKIGMSLQLKAQSVGKDRAVYKFSKA